eukprot:16439933-Heterocapsa_arctica.AAC.1
MGRDVSSSEIPELYISEEERQDVRLHGKYVKEKTNNAEQTGEGQIIQQGQIVTHALNCIHDTTLLDHEHLLRWRQ